MSLSKTERVRIILHEKNIQALLIPTSDAHKSEYIADYWKTIAWLTGFKGSAGTAVITANHAGLWTDSRYFAQATQQLQAPFILHKLKTRTPEFIDWLADNLEMSDRVGFDPQLFSRSEIEDFRLRLEKKHIELVAVPDVFENLWQNRPQLPKAPIVIHEDGFNGLTRIEKIQKIRFELKSNATDQILISALDDIAWVLNLRGNDIEYNPVFRSFLLLNQTEVYLFADTFKISQALETRLINDNIILKPYGDIQAFLSSLKPHSNIEIDSHTANYSLTQSIPENCTILAKSSFCGKLKAIKTASEIEHYKNAQIRDGLAMCNFLHWLETTIKTEPISEMQAAAQSEIFRSQQENYQGLSFGVISAYQENAALPHYSPSDTHPVLLKAAGMYLIDSGAQYFDGTTDITRTVALGKVSTEQIDDFTLVLKGHIRLAEAKFPSGTRGFHLDTLARLDLWQHGKDYGHGTGHGIGYFLNVHEGPQGFAQAHNGAASTIIEPGMLITNEPGLYLEGKYGIRIENVIVCKEDETTTLGNFLKFETLTYCPIDKKLINTNMLTESELHWINQYHKKVFEVLSPLASSEVLSWLEKNTSPLKKA